MRQSRGGAHSARGATHECSVESPPMAEVAELPDETIWSMRSVYAAPLHFWLRVAMSVSRGTAHERERLHALSQHVAAQLLLFPLDEVDVCQHAVLLEVARELARDHARAVQAGERDELQHKAGRRQVPDEALERGVCGSER